MRPDSCLYPRHSARPLYTRWMRAERERNPAKTNNYMHRKHMSVLCNVYDDTWHAGVKSFIRNAGVSPMHNAQSAIGALPQNRRHFPRNKKQMMNIWKPNDSDTHIALLRACLICSQNKKTDAIMTWNWYPWRAEYTFSDEYSLKSKNPFVRKPLREDTMFLNLSPPT